jgi:PAS domain S-box-containing protein
MNADQRSAPSLNEVLLGSGFVEEAPVPRGALLQNIADYAIFMVATDGIITEWTESAYEVLGYRADEIVGKHLSILFTPEEIAAGEPQRELNQAAAKGRAEREAWRVHKNGKRMWMNAISTPVRDAEGNILAFTKISRDLTERKRAVMERETLEANLMTQLEDLRRLHEMSARLIEGADLHKVLEEILDATIALQHADFGNIQLYDPETGAMRIVAQRGFSERFLEHFRVVGPGDNSACGRALREHSRIVIDDTEEDVAFAAHRAIAAQEGFRAVQSTPIVDRNRSIKGVLSTHFRHPHVPPDRELQLTDLYMRLAADLIVRAQGEEAIRAARDAADRANRTKGRFLATASHDLRQPLQTISMLNGVLSRLVSASPTATEAIAKQEQAIKTMTRLLDALLDISKLESGAIKPHICDFALDALLDELHIEFSAIAEKKGLKFGVAASCTTVRSDRTLLGQVLRNLLSNALRYTHTGSVRVQCVQENETIRIDVSDTGVGIPPEHLPYIFDEFYQVGPSSSTKREGHGLGLSIVQRIVRLLSHEIHVRSGLGKGSVFSISLPAGENGGTQASGGAAGKRLLPAKGRHILLVDDEPEVLNATQLLLQVEGYRVTTASTSNEAVATAQKNSDIALLITDFHLSGNERGLDVIQSIREALGPRLKAVLMTGDTSNTVRDVAYDDCMKLATKPLDADEFLDVIGTLLNA